MGGGRHYWLFLVLLLAGCSLRSSSLLLREVDVLRQCCLLAEEGHEEALLRCANTSAHFSSAALEQTPGSRIALISYSTANIFGYGSYSLAMNTAFAQIHQLGMRLFTPADDANYEPRDPRWNKVRILSRVLDEGLGHGYTLDYAIWLDSDLVFLDYSLDFEKIIKDHSQFDLIFSADPEPANGVVNSGCIIVKNSAWARAFLHRWWTKFDRSQGMDQHVFNRVWEESDAVDRIKILPVHSINSHIPSWRHQQPSHQVLHLAGASNVLRSIVFRQGFDALCHCATSSDGEVEHLPPQLGLRREYLQHVHDNLPLNESVSKIEEELQSKRGKILPLSEIKKLFADLQDVLQVGLDNIKDTKVRFSLLHAVNWTYSAMKNTAHHSTTGSSEELESVQGILDVFFNYVILYNQVDPASYLLNGEAEFSAAEYWVQKLLSLVAPSQYGSALYFKFKFHEMVAMLHKQRKNTPHMLKSFENAAIVWNEMHKHRRYGSGNGVMNRFTEIQGILLNIMAFSCSQHSSEPSGGTDVDIAVLKKGLEAAEQSLFFFHESWSHEGHETYAIPLHELFDHAARLYYAGKCAVALSDRRGRQWLEESLAVLSAGHDRMIDGGDENYEEMMEKHSILKAAIMDHMNILKSEDRSTYPASAVKSKKRVFRRRMKREL